MTKNLKQQFDRLDYPQFKVVSKQIQAVDITLEDIADFNKKAVKGMVEALTSKEGYEVMKELSKR